MPLRILVVGAGVCGPAFASLLQGSDARHDITVVERFPSLRTAGQQIDLRAQGIPILKKMCLLHTVKSHCVAETGMDIVDSNGKTMAHFGIKDPTKGDFVGLTNEYEIMRGDLVKVFYEASLKQAAELKKRDPEKEGALTYEFNKSIVDLKQSGDGVDVTFSDGQNRRYDLVVGADGQNSRTRRLAFGQETSDEAFKSIGVHGAYYTIPRIEGEEGQANIYFASERRIIVTRPSGRPTTQVLLFTMKNAERLKRVYNESVEKQKEVFTETFQDAGWQTNRFLSGLKTCNDFYAHEIAQIKMKQLYSGRVVLLGDAGYCPTPFTGMGTTLSLIGAYVLAGELARNDNNVVDALKTYDKIVRPPIDEHQKMGPTQMFFPSSQMGVWFARKVMWAVSVFKFDRMVQWMMPKEKHEWKIPEYSELNLGPST